MLGESMSANTGAEQPDTRRLTRAQANLIIRIILFVAIVVAFGFTLLAAHPAYRSFGSYAAVPNIPQRIQGEGNTDAAFVTLIDPSVVSFPADWHLPDRVCTALRLDRGDTPTALAFSDYAPQLSWDATAEPFPIVSGNEIDGRARDGSFLVMANTGLAGPITARLPFRINWYGQSALPLLKDKPVGGLICFGFQYGGTDNTVHIPFSFTVRFSVKNVHVERLPSFVFSYNNDVSPVDVPQTIPLSRVSIEEYLSKIVVDAPFAVRPLTAAQTEQQATESTYR